VKLRRLDIEKAEREILEELEALIKSRAGSSYDKQHIRKRSSSYSAKALFA